MNTKNPFRKSVYGKNASRKGIIGITLAAIMIASIFAMVAPTAVAVWHEPNPPAPPEQPLNNSIRLYGDVRPQGNAPEIYDNWTEVFDPTVIPKDSATFNPAYLSRYWSNDAITVDGTNAREKIFLRLWYEPCGEYHGSRKLHVYPTINLEYTYMLMTTEYMPTHGHAENLNTLFAFPIVEIPTQSGLGAFDNAGETAMNINVTLLASVAGTVSPYNKTMDGTIGLQKQYDLASMDTVQFLDHKLQYIGKQGTNAVVKVLYAGNYEDDAARGWFVLIPGTPVYFDRHNNNYATANHDPAIDSIRTSYVEYVDGKFVIGKELSQGDTFYVNAVRYDVPAIEVLDTNNDTEADAFKFITLRTKLPKGIGFVQDESVVSSQDIDTISPVEIIPVLPPFNGMHDMIDDINIPLWASSSDERHWTTQTPVRTPLDTDSDGLWIAYDVSERIIPDVNKTEVFYIDETVEKRFSTDLLEKLNERNVSHTSELELYEDWTKFDVQSLPDQYTEFILPEMPDYYTLEGISWPVDLDGDYLITTSLIAPEATGDLYDNKEGPIPAVHSEQRVAFSYDPVDGMDGIDLYVNYNYTNAVNTVRIYGLGNASAPEVYTDWEQPFNPTVIRKDSITFDPAILEWSPEYSMSAQNENCDLKEYLRAWYVPEFRFNGEHCLGDIKPAIITETTYMLIDSQDKKPWHGEANTTWFAFPIVADPLKPQIGLDSFENPGLGDMSAMENLVQLTYVNGSVTDLNNSLLHKTTNGTIRIEKTYILNPGDEIQFIDHKLKFEGIFDGFNTVDVWYCGNVYDDLIANNITLSANTTFIGRHYSIPYYTAQHVNPNLRTWYARYNVPLNDGRAMITVGKELQQGDIFYVDGVRYEIPAIEVLDWDGNVTNGAEKFKFITLRTPYPKYLSGDETMLDECTDDGSPGTSSEYIVKIHSCNAIPVLPPLNMDHEIVDDTDVVLWQPLKLLHKWPYGDPNGVPGVEYFPCAERYLTMQYPPAAWQQYFCVIPIDTDGDMVPRIPTDWQIWDGPYYPDRNLPCGWQLCQCGIWMSAPHHRGYETFDDEHWIANDVNERIIGPIDPLAFCWKSEGIEPRYSTNLLEILNEYNIGLSNLTEDWTKYDIQTLPDRYTEFKLPVIPSLNPVVYVGDDYQQTFEPDLSDYPGSYLITTSFIAPNAKGDLNEYQEYETSHNAGSYRNRFAFTYNASDGTGLYMNENVTIPIPPEGVPFTIVLDQGANYISLPVMPNIKDPKAIFGPEVNVWGYDAGTGVWATVSAVAAGEGYYVYAPKPKTVTVYGTGVSLPTWAAIAAANPWTSGWNLVGPGNTSVDVPPSGVQILRYSKVMHDFVPVPPSDKLEPGVGYWAYK
jgi:hypothetical protein